MAVSNKSIVIGIDGATWNLIMPFVENGKLPTFKRLIEEGTYGSLKSTIPASTGPAWASAFTGVNPGKHGIFFLYHYVGYYTKPVNATDLRSPPIWRILKNENLKVNIINVPQTYPPDHEINGIMISGMGTPSLECDFTHPKDFRNKLLSTGYILNTSMTSRIEPTFILDMLEKRIEVTLGILKDFDWDFFAVVFVATDRAQHLFWKYGNIICEVYSKIDDFLKQLLEITEEKVNIIILSDHGFQRVHKKILANNLLRNMGLLKTKGGKGKKTLRRLRLTRKNLNKVLKKAHLHFLQNLVPENIKKRIPFDKHLRIRQSRLINLDDVDWAKTSAWFHVENLKINLKGREPQGIVHPGKEYDELLNRIIQGLQNLRDPVTKKEVFNKVFKRDDIYHGPFLKKAWDIVVVPKEGYELKDYVEDEPIIGIIEPFNTSHHPNGIFLAYGPDIERSRKIFNANIMDVTPTILHMMGLPVPKYMDGRVLKDVFKKGSIPGKREVRYSNFEAKKWGIKKEVEKEVYSKEEEEKIRERLRRLGYL